MKSSPIKPATEQEARDKKNRDEHYEMDSVAAPQLDTDKDRVHSPMLMEIGISEKDRQSVVNGLSSVMAATYRLYLKTQNFHWNVTGPMFPSLHSMFERQYQELAEAVDLLAERIRTLGYHAPASFAEFEKLTQEQVEQNSVCAERMLRILSHGNEAIIADIRKVMATVIEAQDFSSADILVKRLQVHEKANWMLRSTLKADSIDANAVSAIYQ